ncbi:ketopantoate reductase [Roseiarcus fermentans]|uniref:2-dehydropantoate 2-reductase n=1 Tax=Roseiarcus fermentans TaxID=1473586 RepID=A0A366F125_9HYPH|nr:2-dehydropantoate 2-reductase [Roseiarcus fermentans]RBP07415.1 ketopantoate reductase [Roseiarcus fermentans]
MRILVVGAGATGGYFGARLAEAGRDVTFLVRPDRAAQLRRDGLRVLSPHGDIRLSPRLLVTGEATEPFDVVLLAVKALELERAFDDFAPAVGPQTMILPFLNGLRHIDLLTARFGETPTLGGVCVVAATLDRHGRIVQLTGGTQALTYGERDGSMSERVAKLDEALKGAGFDTRLSSAILLEMWEKWVMLASAGAATCLMRGAIGEIEAVEGGAEATLRCLAETAAIAEASGYPPRTAFLDGTRTMLTQKGSTLATSMYRDMLSGQPVEVEHILGDLTRRARALDVDSPLLDAATVKLRVYQSHIAKHA